MDKLLRILIVDDSQIFCELLQNELEAFDVDLVDTCNSGERALEIISQVKSHYDAVFIDLHMEGMDGIELIRHLDKLRYRGGVIIVSALDKSIVEHTMEVVRKLNLQLLGSILKPFDRSLIAFMVRRIRSMRPKTSENLPLSQGAVREAIAEDRFEAYYQPLIDGQNNALHSVEGLSRLRDRNNRIITPDKFLPTIEHYQLFNEFLPRILRKTLRDYKTICEKLHISVPLRINIHKDQLGDETLPEQLLHGISLEEINPESLTLEISERFPQDDVQLRNLARLRIAGFTLSLDDYGSGFTNIRQLKALPFNDIKIDKELIVGMHRDRALRTIVESMKQVADDLNIQVIAKGVHDPSDLIMLDKIGIHYFQGHFFSRPKPAVECIRWLKDWKAVLNEADKRLTPKLGQ